MVQLTDSLVHLLDDAAAGRGMSRSAIIREALERYLAEEGHSLVTAQLVRAYEKTPQAEPDTWASMAGLGDQATAEALARLDEEEHRSGVGPW